jgi:hypothetical protein
MENEQDFISFLADLSYGDVNARLTDKLHELVEAVENTGAAGSLTLKIGVKKDGKMAVTSVDIAAKIPEEPIPGNVFFFGKKGSLEKEDPRQMSFKQLEENVAPLRSIEKTND